MEGLMTSQITFTYIHMSCTCTSIIITSYLSKGMDVCLNGNHPHTYMRTHTHLLLYNAGCQVAIEQKK